MTEDRTEPAAPPAPATAPGARPTPAPDAGPAGSPDAGPAGGPGERSLDASRRLRVPVLGLGGTFMTAAEMKAEAAPLGLPAGALYFRGRIGVLGDVTAQTAHGLLGIFPAPVVHGVWASTAALPAPVAVERYRAAYAAWGRAHLTDLPGLAEATAAMLRVVDGTWTGTLPLADAWARVERPDEPAERAAYAAMVLREVRGGLHFAALALRGVPVPFALLADPLGGVRRMLRTGWTQELADELTAGFTPEHARRWRLAEDDTDVAFAGCLAAALGEDGAAELADRLAALHAASKARRS